MKHVAFRRLGGFKLEIEFSDGTTGVRDYVITATRYYFSNFHMRAISTRLADRRSTAPTASRG